MGGTHVPAPKGSNSFRVYALFLVFMLFQAKLPANFWGPKSFNCINLGFIVVLGGYMWYLDMFPYWEPIGSHRWPAMGPSQPSGGSALAQRWASAGPPMAAVTFCGGHRWPSGAHRWDFDSHRWRWAPEEHFRNVFSVFSGLNLLF